MSHEALAQLPREVGSPSLEVSRSCGDVALRNTVSGHGGVGLGLDLGWTWGSEASFPILIMILRCSESCHPLQHVILQPEVYLYPLKHVVKSRQIIHE